MRKVSGFVMSAAVIGLSALALAGCSTPASGTDETPQNTSLVSAVSDTPYDSGTAVVSSETEFQSALSAALSAVMGQRLSGVSTATVSKVASTVQNQLLSLIQSTPAARNRSLSAGVYLKGNDSLTFAAPAEKAAVPTGAYDFSLTADAASDLTTSEAAALKNFISDSLSDGTTVFQNKTCTLSFSGNASASIQNAAVQKGSGTDTVTAAVKKAVLSVRNIGLNLKASDMTFVYHNGDDAANSDSVFTADYKLGGNADVNLAFVLSEPSGKIPGGKIGLTFLFDKQMSFTQAELTALFADLEKAGAAMPGQAGTYGSAAAGPDPMSIITGFLSTHGINLNEVTIAAAVYDNAGNRTFAKTYTITGFVGLFMVR
jgi:hypothetical protein